MTKEELLSEVEDLIRTMPQGVRQATPESFAWRGRAAALVEAWNDSKSPLFDQYGGEWFSGPTANQNFSQVMLLIHQMRFDLQMKTRGPLSKVVDRGSVFDYFDEIRKIIEAAQQDLLFVDPYLDADFAARYLPHVRQGVRVRLLAREKLATLMPAVQLYRQQSQLSVEVRSSPNFHDRYVLVDGAACYQSGASFKDGGRTAPTTLTQITDAFPAVLQTYETLWNSAVVQP